MGTNGPTIPRLLNADDIGWTLESTSTPRLETTISGTYLAGLSHDELFAYVIDLREDAGALRRTLHAALACIARLTDQLTRTRRTLVDLQEQRRVA